MRIHTLLFGTALPLSALVLANPTGCGGGVTGDVAMDMAQPVGDGDPLPQRSIAFFKGACPTGWSMLPGAVGRFMVPTTGTLANGTSNSRVAALSPGEDRTHAHSLTASGTLNSVSYAGLTGGSGGLANTDATVASTGVSSSSSAIPYVQLMTCRKDAAPPAGAPALPTGMLIFYDGNTCPDGFAQTTSTQGRFLVALPKSGTAGATFGGAPIDAQVARNHTHNATVPLSTTSYGIALLSGGAAGGYAANGSYSLAATMTDGDVSLPYVQYLQCRKQ